ncbi:hypothetical protein CGG82_16890 [Vibrio parahaemolyticus]|uniref:transposase domain-containing protein n=1 Tax=Vibrio parahaemolyticus TaxID=670 RepID=UPI001121F8E4|nr:transposase domain-containing protein [Vibrio parahaemolyticus]MBE3834286.1 hypothetical protein [Vibrio parahaemolyticus]MCZ6289030.1 DNA-binding protein [Vibrio parahaemolyticus]TOR12781.1 hypothetical protein CGG82_16890 [Vibrio parahaemolyticus]UJW91805.1 Mu transposase C-terminal domain-containing protein [Vibrio parahaemolyticus]UJX06037.1 Mu transposase C-terminal domain-containing protein [Vibrio parahaemolyticus]
MFYTVQELVGLPGMPDGERNVRIKLSKIATDEHKRKREVPFGRKPMEFHIDCLPKETRLALIQAQNKKAAERAHEENDSSDEVMVSAERWQVYENATAKQKQEAEKRHQLCLRVVEYENEGMPITKAYEQVASESDYSVATIKSWFLGAKKGLRKYNIPERDWLAVLVDTRGGVRAECVANIPEFIWELFKADYLRPEMKSGTVTECYRRVKRVAKRHGVELPTVETFRNRVRSHIPKELILLMHKGASEFYKLALPAQRRMREHLYAMQVVTGDGHVARVLCESPTGERFRPTVWAFTDVHSSMIVGYAVDYSENTDMLGIAIYRMVSKYGIPKVFNLDRGSAALSEAMTGGMSRPKRNGSGRLVHKKFDSAEVEGVIRSMGSTVNWIKGINDEDNGTRSGNSRANPIERLWHSKGGFGQFEREPAFDGAYLGANINDKPANYGSHAVPIEQFVELLDAWVHRWNHETGRQTEMAKAGGLSYAQVFERSYSKVSIPKATERQLAMCLLRTKRAVKVYNGGLIELNTGQNAKKQSYRYRSEMLFDYVGSKVNVRFNPYDTTKFVLAYDVENDRLIGQIPLFDDADFFNKGSAIKNNDIHQQQLDRVKWLGSQVITQTVNDVAEATAPQEHERTDVGGFVPAVTEMKPDMPKDFGGFEQKRKRAVGHDTHEEDYSEFSSEEFNNAFVQRWGE